MNNEEKILSILEQMRTENNVRFTSLEQSVSTIEQKVSTVEQNMSTIEQNMSTIEQNMSTIEQNMSTIEQSVSTIEQRMSSFETEMHELKLVHENITVKTLELINEGISGINEKFGRLDRVEDKVENHGYRIFALEQAVTPA